MINLDMNFSKEVIPELNWKTFTSFLSYYFEEYRRGEINELYKAIKSAGYSIDLLISVAAGNPGVSSVYRVAT